MALKDTQRIGPFPLGMDNRRADFNLALGKDEGGGHLLRDALNVDVTPSGSIKTRAKATPPASKERTRILFGHRCLAPMHSADAAIDPGVHTKLLTVYGDGISEGLNLGTARGGAIGKAAGETWAGTVLATGNAVFFRYVGSADTGVLSTTEPRLQGRVGVSGAELNISSLALTSGNTQAVNFISISLPG